MLIKADEISELIRQKIEGFAFDFKKEETGVVISIGDGIARIYGLDNVMYNELLEFPGRYLRHRPEPGGRQRRLDPAGRKPQDQGRRHRQTHRPDHFRAGRAKTSSAAWSTRWASPWTKRTPSDADDVHAHRGPGAGRSRTPAGQGAPADRHQGHRRHDPHRPRPARVDHRRPPDRARPPSPWTPSSTRRARTSSAFTWPSARSSRPSPRWSRP